MPQSPLARPSRGGGGGRWMLGAASEPRRFVHPLATTPRRDMSPIRISISSSVKDSHDPFQGITDLEGYSLAGLGSALPRQRLTVIPLNKELALCRQVRGGRTHNGPSTSGYCRSFIPGTRRQLPFWILSLQWRSDCRWTVPWEDTRGTWDWRPVL